MPEVWDSHTTLPVMPRGAPSARAAARLDQVVCTLEGMAALLQDTPGDFAVVVHGDRDCLGVLVQGMDHPGAERFFGTQLSEVEAVAGHGVARLRECLEAVCAAPAPPVVFVLGTCLSALLGEDDTEVARAVGRASGVEVVPLGGAGMGFVTQGEILDRFGCLMLDAAAAGSGGAASGGLGLVGFDPGPEVRDQLARLGVTLRAVLGRGAPLGEWLRLPAGRAHGVLDAALYPGLLARLREAHGQQTVELPFPVGSRATDRFFAALRPFFGAGAPDSEVLGAPAEAARRAVAEGRRRSSGARLGFNLGSMKNLDPRTLARAGLGDLEVFEELGFEPVLLVQGDDRPDRQAALREALRGLGCRAPFAIFRDTVFFGELCRAEGCDLVYASDHLREQAEAAGVGLLPIGALAPGYGQVEANLSRILEALEGAR